MMRFRIEYGVKAQVRCADNAEAAIERLCDQYGWNYRVKLVDADTRGEECCEALIDTEGGINYGLRAVATRI